MAGLDQETKTPLTSEQLRKVLGHFATGVTVVTTRLPADEPRGFTVNSFTSVSLDPPLVLVCVAHATESFQAMSQAEYFAVNFLAEDQEELSRTFAAKQGDRFARAAYTESPHGSPLLAGCLGYVECRKIASHAHGDHTIIIGEVLAAQANGGSPLLFYRGSYTRLEPSLLPTKR
jgi:flavin reductase (DIM6/NTAB) family NADH-FMN oxidoreductase RutF